MQIFSLSRALEIVDIGANPFSYNPPYKQLLATGMASFTGFEPEPAAFAAIQHQTMPRQRYLPWAVGDGGTHTLHICSAPSGMTSLLEPEPATHEIFATFKEWGRVLRKETIQTRRLDDIEEIARIDYLKMDIQGGELAVLQHGQQKLAETVAIQVEVSFVPLYKNQPSLGEVDVELRRQGFIPHAMTECKKWVIAPCIVNNDPRLPLNQLLEADIVYVRDYRFPERMSDDQLKALAAVAHYAYGSFDLVMRCITVLQERGSLDAEAGREYLDFVRNGRQPPQAVPGSTE